MQNFKVILIQLVKDRYIETDGTATDVFAEIDPAAAKQLETLGTRIESLRVLSATYNPTTNLRWAVHVCYSLAGRTYSTPVALHTHISTAGEAIQAEYTTAATFCAPLLRGAIGMKNSTGSARESATVSAWLVVTLKT